jgi:hypothetical protein
MSPMQPNAVASDLALARWFGVNGYGRARHMAHSDVIF